MFNYVRFLLHHYFSAMKIITNLGQKNWVELSEYRTLNLTSCVQQTQQLINRVQHYPRSQIKVHAATNDCSFVYDFTHYVSEHIHYASRFDLRVEGNNGENMHNIG